MDALLRASRPLRAGDKVALIRPGMAGKFPEWERVSERFSSRGLVPVMVGGDPGSNGDPYYADDSTRAGEIRRALLNPAFACVLAYRGGSGAIRLLSGWTPLSGRMGPVPLVCGFSDMTYLHAALARTMNMVTFWGPNARELADEKSFDLWWEAMSGGLSKGSSLPLGECRGVRPGLSTGRLWGGNLESLAHLSGTPFFPDLSGRILLLEDIDEPFYAIDRSLRTLFLAGALRSIAGVVLGPFSRIERREDDPASSVPDLLLPLIGPVPVISSSLPGHACPMATWPMNLRVELSSSSSGRSSLRLLESPFESDP